jgi:hypothetical protein
LRGATIRSLVPRAAVSGLSWMGGGAPEGGFPRGGAPPPGGPPTTTTPIQNQGGRDQFFLRHAQKNHSSPPAPYSLVVCVVGLPPLGGPPPRWGVPPIGGGPPPLSPTVFLEKFATDEALGRPAAHFGPQKPCFWGYPQNRRFWPFLGVLGVPPRGDPLFGSIDRIGSTPTDIFVRFNQPHRRSYALSEPGSNSKHNKMSAG